MNRSLLRVFVCLLLSALTSAAEWPKGYIVAEDSTSPDGRFGVLIPNRETGTEIDDDGSPKLINYLVDVKARRLLGKIKGGGYWEGENHSHLDVSWAEDSSCAVVEYDGRYGFALLHVLQPTAKGFTQTEIGGRIHEELTAAMSKASHGKDKYYDGEVTSLLGKDGKLRVRVTAMNNPKQLPDITTYYAYFQGTYDVKAARWKVTDARPLNAELYDVLDTALRYPDFAGKAFADDQERATALDEMLNQTYGAVRSILPPERFAAVKSEQLAWLKQRDAAGSVAAKCTLLEARIKALRALLW